MANVDDLHDENSGTDDGGPSAEFPSPDASSSTNSDMKRKKRKKKSKASKALSTVVDKLSGQSGSGDVPEELVHHVYDHVKQENPEDTKDLDEENVRRALAALKVMDVIDGKSGLGGKNRKDMGEHKVVHFIISNIGFPYLMDVAPQFWRTQPVPQIGKCSE
jgi:glycylpeptide N-tetradecanoyltransferase